MKKQIVNATSQTAAAELCPWADAFREVDSGAEGQRAWMCFESSADAELWDNQK